ncbi:MAG: SAM hydrolase/SAM-dependent halogenase family protein [Promethearchaeia archaeon]
MPNKNLIGLVTDFGEKGAHYIAGMKGVILNISQDIKLIDISHDITPFSVLETSYLIFTMYQYFPANTVFLIVVDPGVGTSRKIVTLKTHSSHYFVGPDNGIFTHLFSSNNIKEVVSVENEEYFREKISQTFHGRDIMAPVSAYIALGVNLDQLGPKLEVQDLHQVPLDFTFHQESGRIEGIIQYIDSFGTATTNLKLDDDLKLENTSIQIEPSSEMTLISKNKEYSAKFCTHFSEVNPGELLFLKGSYGYLEIAKNQGNAASETRLSVGDPIVLKL